MPMNGEALVKPDQLYIKTHLHGILFTMQYFPALKRSKFVLICVGALYTLWLRCIILLRHYLIVTLPWPSDLK